MCPHFLRIAQKAVVGAEVDLVAEAPDGGIVGIEVKAAQSVQNSNFKGLRLMKQRLGGTFIARVVLYTGSNVLPFGDGLAAMSISVLWS